MLQKEIKKQICIKCSRQSVCINAHSEKAVSDKSCFKETGCLHCLVRTTCTNATKEAFELPSRLHGTDIPVCYRAPQNCNECSRATHCKNKNFKTFALNYQDYETPLCFSRFHSTKWSNIKSQLENLTVIFIYAFFQNASYPLCASYKSNLLVTS